MVDGVAVESGQVWVEGYTTSRGVHVEGHYRRHTRPGDNNTISNRLQLPAHDEPQTSRAGAPAAGRQATSVTLQRGHALAQNHTDISGGAVSDSAAGVHAAEVAVGDGPGRCAMCGEYSGAGHQCPVRPVGLPDASYAGMTGDERVQTMLVDLDRSVQAIVDSGQLQAWLDVMASNGLNRWSANNRLMAVLQLYGRGDSLENVHLMGFRQWTEFDRTVNKGAKAVWILAPVTRRFTSTDDNGAESDERRVVGFKAVPVFNISDTHGKPLPKPPGNGIVDGEATPGTLEGLRDRVSRAGYTYSEEQIPDCRPATGEGTLGFTHPATKRIVVDSRLTPAMKSSTLAHELSHVHCGHVDAAAGEYRRHRGRMETEAEMTAYLVNRSRGMSQAQAESLSSGYIAGWSKGEPAVMRASMDTAVKAYNAIMDGTWPK